MRDPSDAASSAAERPATLALSARLAPQAMSTGCVLLAALAPAALENWITARPLACLTAPTTTDADAFRAVLGTVREHDHCTAIEKPGSGVTALDHRRPFDEHL